MARDDDQAAEVCRLKRELQRVTEERDIQKKRPPTSPRMQSEVRVHRRASPAVFDPRHVSMPPHLLLCHPHRRDRQLLALINES
ncbi:hypothetical protein Xaut_0621 [Xanthobacter versatilis]|uniref:Uncharacterized protein n=1 Tax=Xanthobacter autotrophicus (strain ATCC BAA-1158 / Py2) TaxID=78245 RepID=A7ICY1_XANP2|nr:hypothetical protein Xaut_0621 [Xanthobacter autotrophicus Py2]